MGKILNHEQSYYLQTGGLTMNEEYFIYLPPSEGGHISGLAVRTCAKNERAAMNKLNYLADEAEIDLALFGEPVITDYPDTHCHTGLPEMDTFSAEWVTRYKLPGEQGRTWYPRDPQDEHGDMNTPDVTHLPVTPLKPREKFMQLSRDVRTAAVLKYGFSVIDRELTKAQLDQLIRDSLKTTEDDPYLADFIYAVRLPELGEFNAARFAAFIDGVHRRFGRGDADADYQHIRDFCTRLLAPETGPGDPARFRVVIALLVMGKNPAEASASDVRKAKELIDIREPDWRAWHTSLQLIPGVLTFPEALLYELTLDGMKNLALVNDSAGRREYIRRQFAGHPLLPDFPTEEESKHHETQQDTPGKEHLLADAAPPAGAVEPDTEQQDDTAQSPETPSPVAERTGPFYARSAEGELRRANKIKGLDDLLAQGFTEISKDEYQQRKNTPGADDMSAPVAAFQPCASDEGKKREVATAEAAPAVSPAAPEPKIPAPAFPAVFDFGRFEAIPNDHYHAARGISSSMVKDARISLMYYHGRHISRGITRETSDALTFGTLVHTMALEPEKLSEEFARPFVLPEGAISTTAEMKVIIEKYNATLPAALGTDEIKALLETHNASLPAAFSLGATAEETAQIYMQLPEDFQHIAPEARHTGTAMKACIKEYNATLPPQLKTGGGRDALLDELEKIQPDTVSEERTKPQPLNSSGSKDELATLVRQIAPETVFAGVLRERWEKDNAGKTLISQVQHDTAVAIREALLAHPSASRLLTHPSRASEVSYFGMDEETALEVRVRPDIELEINGTRIAADLKTTSMGRVKQDYLRARLHREITERDYHVSAAMYSEVAGFDQFFWIFVNKDPGYHWVAVIEASPDLLELGSLEYHQTLRRIQEASETGCWPAPLTEDYTDELNDFDMRRLEMLRPV
jgi:exodeoxyribonuclease VIII